MSICQHHLVISLRNEQLVVDEVPLDDPDPWNLFLALKVLERTSSIRRAVMEDVYLH